MYQIKKFIYYAVFPIDWILQDEKIIKKKNVFLNNGRDFKDNFILLNEIAYIFYIYVFKIIMVSFKKNEITLKISPAIRSQIKQFVLKIIISITIYWTLYKKVKQFSGYILYTFEI